MRPSSRRRSAIISALMIAPLPGATRGTAPPTTAPATTAPATTAPATTAPATTTVPPPTTTTLPPPVIVHIATTSYVVPAARPIVDGWRPPPDRYGAGNRGWELGTAVGDRLVAPQRGTVAFAGQVGGTRYLVIDHPDGIRTTLGGLGALLVRAGSTVRQGQVVATAGGTTFFGARYGDHYLDPGLLVRPGIPERSWLVPLRTGEPAATGTG